MDMELRDKKKKLCLSRFLRSFLYSFQGLGYAVKRELNLIGMLVCAIVTIMAGIVFNISSIEWLFVIISIGLVIGTELINTSIEAALDLVTPTYHPLAKIAKDTAAAAVFTYTLVALAIGTIIFIPKVLTLIERMN